MKYALAVDPGKHGAFCLLSEDAKEITIWKTPETESDVSNLIEEISLCSKPELTYIEAVHSFPDQGISSAFTFGRGTGIIIGCLLSNHMRHEEIQPRSWQKQLAIPPRQKKTVVESKREWKNRLKSHAQKLFPNTKVTLDVADAILIAEVARRNL